MGMCNFDSLQVIKAECSQLFLRKRAANAQL